MTLKEQPQPQMMPKKEKRTPPPPAQQQRPPPQQFVNTGRQSPSYAGRQCVAGPDGGAPPPPPPPPSQQPQQPQQSRRDRQHKQEHGSAIDVNKYKTKVCRNWQQGTPCPYGDRCVFAHGDVDMRRLTDHNPYTELFGAPRRGRASGRSDRRAKRAAQQQQQQQPPNMRGHGEMGNGIANGVAIGVPLRGNNSSQSLNSSMGGPPMGGPPMDPQVPPWMQHYHGYNQQGYGYYPRDDGTDEMPTVDYSGMDGPMHPPPPPPPPQSAVCDDGHGGMWDQPPPPPTSYDHSHALHGLIEDNPDMRQSPSTQPMGNDCHPQPMVNDCHTPPGHTPHTPVCTPMNMSPPGFPAHPCEVPGGIHRTPLRNEGSDMMGPEAAGSPNRGVIHCAEWADQMPPSDDPAMCMQQPLRHSSSNGSLGSDYNQYPAMTAGTPLMAQSPTYNMQHQQHVDAHFEAHSQGTTSTYRHDPYADIQDQGGMPPDCSQPNSTTAAAPYGGSAFPTGPTGAPEESAQSSSEEVSVATSVGPDMRAPEEVSPHREPSNDMTRGRADMQAFQQMQPQPMYTDGETA